MFAGMNRPFGFLTLALCAMLLAWAADAAGECYDADQLTAAEPPPITGLAQASGPTMRDRLGRMVAPVTVNGQGPFRFIVDTGANRSVLSQRLADQLGLTPIGTGEVHSVHGVTIAPLVEVQSLNYGALPLLANAMPLLEGAVLAGEQGLLGVDGMSGRRLRLDFERRCIEISPSRAPRRSQGWQLVRGELRFGHLVVVAGMIAGQRINIIIDTGSDSTLANVALRERLRGTVRIDRARTAYARAYTAGEPIVLDSAILIPRMVMGEVEIRHIIAYVGDFHIFSIWNFIEQPTLLIGMDVLSQTRALEIDYLRGDVHFRLRRRPELGSRIPE